MAKYRTDFVTNSSSSCFIISAAMTCDEVEMKLVEFLEFYNSFTENSRTYDQTFGIPYRFSEQEYIAAKAEEASQIKKYGKSYGYGYDTDKRSIGKIVLMSAEDNSIPWEMFDMIESKFQAVRYHLG